MRHKSFGQGKRSWLDNLIAHVRIRKILSKIQPGAKLLDLGCGYNGDLIEQLGDHISEGIGIDLSVNSRKPNLIKGRVDAELDLVPNTFDVATALAIIEHVDNPTKMLSEIKRVLKTSGRVLITTPSLYGKVPLELMAWIGIISKAEIDDHKRYYTKKSLYFALKNQGFKNIEVQYFGILWLNLFATADK